MERVLGHSPRVLSKAHLDEALEALDFDLHVGTLGYPLFHVDSNHLLQLLQVLYDHVHFLRDGVADLSAYSLQEILFLLMKPLHSILDMVLDLDDEIKVLSLTLKNLSLEDFEAVLEIFRI